MLWLSALAFLGSGAGFQSGQHERTPGEYLSAHPWDAKRNGPILYLTHRPLAVADAPGLEGGFAVFACGTLHVVAPAQMTVIDPDYRDPVNIYDELPRRLKVLYLASSFTLEQWQIASSKGIGLGDLDRDQQAVFRSILPSTFKYENQILGDVHGRAVPPDQHSQMTLSTQEESQVRVKIFKELTLGIWLGDGHSFSAIFPQEFERKKPGDALPFRIDSASEDNNSAFGVLIRKTGPNQPKESDLPYSSTAYNSLLKLPATCSIADLCRSVSSLVHQTIVADARFKDEQVSSLGDSARCGDVLRAIALGLTGTYRKVGHTLVLTSDREGIGATMCKLAYWHWNLSQMVQKESLAWSAKIAANPGLHAIAYAPNDPFTPNEAMSKFMEGDFDQGDKSMPASALSKEWAKLLGSVNSPNSEPRFSQPVSTDKAEPWEEVFWTFVLPTGQDLTWESELGDLNEYTHYAVRHRSNITAQVQKPIALGSLRSAALVVDVSLPDAAAKLPALAKAHQFRELWIQTSSSSCVAAAVNAAKPLGIAVRLIAEPFAATGNEPLSELDRTISNEPYGPVAKVVQTSDWVLDSSAESATNGFFTNVLAQNSSVLAPRWRALRDLAHTPGLAGAVVLSSTPGGYEPKGMWAEYEPPQLANLLALGYTTQLREKFLLADSVDPVDLLEARDQVDLSPLDQSISSFGDLNNYTYGKVESSPESEPDRWSKMRSEENMARVSEFFSIFPQPPLVEWRRGVLGTALTGNGLISPLSEGTRIPTVEEVPDGTDTPANGYFLQKIGFPMTPSASYYLARRLAKRFKKSPGGLAVDLRAVPAGQQEQVLNLWFSP